MKGIVFFLDLLYLQSEVDLLGDCFWGIFCGLSNFCNAIVLCDYPDENIANQRNATLKMICTTVLALPSWNILKQKNNQRNQFIFPKSTAEFLSNLPSLKLTTSVPLKMELPIPKRSNSTTPTNGIFRGKLTRSYFYGDFFKKWVGGGFNHLHKHIDVNICNHVHIWCSNMFYTHLPLAGKIIPFHLHIFFEGWNPFDSPKNRKVNNVGRVLRVGSSLAYVRRKAMY